MPHRNCCVVGEPRGRHQLSSGTGPLPTTPAASHRISSPTNVFMTRGGRRTGSQCVAVEDLVYWRASQLQQSKGTGQCAASLHSQYYFNFCDPVNIRFGEANYNEIARTFAASVPIIHNAWTRYVSNDFTTFDDFIELCMWVCSARIDITTTTRGCAKKLLRKHPKAL